MTSVVSAVLDAQKAEALELLAKIARETEKLLALTKKRGSDISDIGEQSIPLIDYVYELELLTKSTFDDSEDEQGDSDDDSDNEF